MHIFEESSFSSYVQQQEEKKTHKNKQLIQLLSVGCERLVEGKGLFFFFRMLAVNSFKFKKKNKIFKLTSKEVSWENAKSWNSF